MKSRAKEVLRMNTDPALTLRPAAASSMTCFHVIKPTSW